jgi:putative addiction module killer protein
MVRWAQRRCIGKGYAALYQLAAGNWSNVKGVGAGVFERKIDVGPGYRIYFGKDGNRVVILLGSSTKQRQQQAINPHYS